MSTILREIDIDIVRINPRGNTRGSPQYVFAVHPLNTRVRRPSTNGNSIQGAIASTFIGSTLRPIDEHEIPIVHEVARTYSQCRTLYKNLKMFTNGAKKSACQCCCDDFHGDGNRSNDDDSSQHQSRQSACPCGALFSLLDAFMFPRKRLLHRRSRCVFQERRFALNLFIKSVLQKLQSLHDHEFEQIAQYQQQCHPDLPWENDNDLALHAALVRCKVIAALLRFLALEDETLVSKIREMSQRLFGKLNLEGWHSDRKNLYFINEDSEDNTSNNSVDGASRRNNNAARSQINSSRSSSVAEESEDMSVGSSLDLEEMMVHLKS